MPAGLLARPGSPLLCSFSGKSVTGHSSYIWKIILANDVITQLQARNETLTQAIARYGSLNASTLHTLSNEQIKITRLTQQLTESALRREGQDRQRNELIEKTQSFAGQIGKLLNVETPDWNLPYTFQTTWSI